MRVGDLCLAAGLGESADHVARILAHGIVDRAEAARASAFVVDAQAAADVNGIDGRAQAQQALVEAGAFTQAELDVADVGDLRAQVEMHQLQAGQRTGLAQALHHGEHLAGGETELGLLAAGVLPLAHAHRGQAGTQADTRGDAEILGLLEDQRQLGELFHHQVDAMAELLAHQRQADVLAVLVAVADDQRGAVAGECQHGEQLRFAAGFEADPAVAALAGGEDLLDHAALLVDLDRVHGGIATLVLFFAHGQIEGVAQLLDAVMEDVAEAYQYRQAQAGFAQLVHQRGERQGRPFGLAAKGRTRAWPLSSTSKYPLPHWSMFQVRRARWAGPLVVPVVRLMCDSLRAGAGRRGAGVP